MDDKTENIGAVTVLPPERFSAFSSISNFESAQRMARILCSSTIVPQSYRDNIADCVIALEMANRIGANPLAVMQNLYIVHGKPAWSSQFLIACVNASGKFSALRYRVTGEKGDDSWGCIAWATDKLGERLESPEVTIGMAKAEGWFSKNGSKWKTMPDLMLRYRVATLFARLYAPELTMGIATEDEVIDIAPVVTDPQPRRAGSTVIVSTEPEAGAEAAPEPPTRRTRKPKAEPSPEPSPGSAGGPPQAPEAAPAPLTPPTAPEPSAPAPAAAPSKYVLAVRMLLAANKVPEGALLKFLRAEKEIDDTLSSIEEIDEFSPLVLRAAHDNWTEIRSAVIAVAFSSVGK